MPQVLKLYNSNKKDPHYIGFNNQDWYYEEIGEIDLWVHKENSVTDPPFNHYTINNEYQKFFYLLDSAPVGTIVAIRLRFNTSKNIPDLVLYGCSLIGSSEIYNYSKNQYNDLNIIGLKGSPMGTALEKSSNDIAWEMEPRLNNLPKKLEMKDFFFNSLKIDGEVIKYANGNVVPGLFVFTLTNQMEIINMMSFDIKNNPINGNTQFNEYIKSVLIHEVQPLILVIARAMMDPFTAYIDLTQDSIDTVKKLGSKFISDFLEGVRLGVEQFWFLLSSGSKSLCEYSGDLGLSGTYMPFTDSLNFGPKIVAGSKHSTRALNPPLNSGSFIEIEGISEGVIQKAPGLIMTVLDEVTGQILGSYSILLRDLPSKPNEFDAKQATEFILNEISVGSLVIICSSDIPKYLNITLPEYLVNAIRTLGSNLIPNRFGQTTSLVIIGRKGSPSGSAIEEIAYFGDNAICISTTYAPYNKMVKPFIEIKAISKGWGQGDPWYPNKVGDARFYINSQLVEFFEPSRGLNVMVVNPTLGKIEYMDTFDTCGWTSESTRFINMLNEQEPNSVIAIAVMDDGSNAITDEALKAIKTIIGGTLYSKTSLRASYCLIGEIGNPSAVIETYSPGNGLNYPAVCVKKQPVKAVYINSTVTFKQIRINSTMDFFINNSLQNGIIIDNVKIWADYQNPAIQDIFDYISSLPVHTIVVAAINVSSISERSKLALSMIGSSSINLSLDQPKVQYYIVGRKGSSPGSALEMYSKKNEVISLHALEPSFLSQSKELASTGLYVMNFNREFYYDPIFDSNIDSHKFKKDMKSISGNNYKQNPAVSSTLSKKSKKPKSRRTFKALIVGQHYFGTDLLLDYDGDYFTHYFKVWSHMWALSLLNPGSLVMMDSMIELPPNLEQYNSFYYTNNIMQKIDWLKDDINAGDVIYFMFDGHGCLNHSPTELAQRFEPIPLGVNFSLFISSCYSAEIMLHFDPHLLSQLYPMFTTGPYDFEYEDLNLLYCANKIFQRPFLERTYNEIVNLMQEQFETTGIDEIGPNFGNQLTNPEMLFLVPIAHPPQPTSKPKLFLTYK
eukprot:gene6093-7591_t